MGHKETRGYYDDTREFNYWTSIKQHEENLAELTIKVDNFNREKDYQDAQNVKTYQHAVAQQDFKHDQEIRQFERSNQIADEQINFNRKSAHFAKDSLDEATYERYVKFQFEAASSLLKHRVQQQKTRQGRRELLQGHGLATAKAAIQAQENLVKTLKKVGTAKVRGGRGRSLQKNVGEWWAVAGREQSAMQSMMTKANEQVATKLYGIEYTMGVEAQKRHLTDLAQKETKLSIERAHKRGTQEILMKWEGADMAANHKRLLEPIKGPAPIKPAALPRLDGGSIPWEDTFDSHGGILDKSGVTTLGVYTPQAPGLSDEFRDRHGIKGDDFKEAPRDLWTHGPVFDYEEEGGGAIGFGGTGARQGSISVGSVTSAVGAGMMAASAIGAATATGAGAAAGGLIGLGGAGTIGLGMMGPIGMGIAAIGFIGTIFDWW